MPRRVPAGARRHHGLLHHRRRNGQDDFLPSLGDMTTRQGIITSMTYLSEQADEETQEKELYDAFSELGSDPELSDVEFAFQAQAEVALRD